MNELPGTVRLSADWAVVGKHPGRTMGYEVLAGSLPPDRAQRYYWGAATGTPDDLAPADGLPWRVFLGGVPGEASCACVHVETTWDGSFDGTGVASYTWRLCVLGWNSAGADGLTWSALDRAAPREQPDTAGAAVSIEVPRTRAAELADTVDRLGFDWAAGIAALLLEGRQVALVPPPGARLPGVDERVLILDAVCSLLPYGCRAWLSAATWTGQSEHKLLLVFAPTARTEQFETWLGGARPPEPRGSAARDYLYELLRIRAKRGSTEELVAHLLRATEPLAAQEPQAALRALREADLVDSVVADIARGHGDLRDVLRVLQLHPASSLGDHRMALIVPFLAGCEAREAHEAHEALLRCWSHRTPRLLADDVLGSPATKETFTRATHYLRVLDGLEADRPGSFEELFTIMAGAPNQEPGWVAALIHFATNTFGYLVDAVDQVVIGSPEVGRAWLRKLVMDHSRKPLPPLTRLVGLALRTARVEELPGWLRFAGLLAGALPEEQVGPSDAAEFADAGDDAWSVALAGAAANGLPVVVSLMWSRLRVLASSSPHRLLDVLDEAVAPGGPRLTPGAAADADLLGVLARAAAQGQSGPPSMPRLGRFAGPGGAEAYAAALYRRIDTDADLKGPAIGALLGETPDAASWAVVRCLIGRLPSAEESVLNAVEERLSRGPGSGDWIDVLSEHQVRTLGRRRELGWLPRVWELRGAVRAGEPLGELAGITAGAHMDESISAQYLDELIGYLCTWGPVTTDRFARELNGRVSGLAVSLYKVLGRSERAGQLCQELHHFHHAEAERHHQMGLVLGTASGGTAPPPPSSPSPPSSPAPVPSQPWERYDYGPRPAPTDNKKGRLQRWMPGWRP